MTGTGMELLIQSATTLSIELSAEQKNAFALFHDELHKWNQKVNLTAIRSERDTVLKHFVDSLVLLPMLAEAKTMLDLGSGGGFPVIPLKIMLPVLTAVSVDAVEKKILFQRHMARLLRLHDFTALHERGEQLVEQFAGRFDRIVSRAFSDLQYFARLAEPLLKDTGYLIAMKGREGISEAAEARAALARLGLERVECIQQALPESGDERCLVIMARG